MASSHKFIGFTLCLMLVTCGVLVDGGFHTRNQEGMGALLAAGVLTLLLTHGNKGPTLSIGGHGPSFPLPHPGHSQLHGFPHQGLGVPHIFGFQGIGLSPAYGPQGLGLPHILGLQGHGFPNDFGPQGLGFSPTLGPQGPEFRHAFGPHGNGIPSALGSQGPRLSPSFRPQGRGPLQSVARLGQGLFNRLFRRNPRQGSALVNTEHSHIPQGPIPGHIPAHLGHMSGGFRPNNFGGIHGIQSLEGNGFDNIFSKFKPVPDFGYFKEQSMPFLDNDQSILELADTPAIFESLPFNEEENILTDV